MNHWPYPRSQKRQERYISLESLIKEHIPKAKGLQANKNNNQHFTK